MALALAFGTWGLVVVLAGLSLAFTTGSFGLTSEPSRIFRSRLFVLGGAIAASIALGSVLMVFEKERRRSVALLTIAGISWSSAVGSLGLIYWGSLGGWTVGALTSIVAGFLLGGAACAIEGRMSLGATLGDSERIVGFATFGD